MIEALLHGKLSREQENMEDILTSNVFGLLKYLPPSRGLLPFLSRAVSSENPTNPIAHVPDEASAEYIFWPTLDYEGLTRCEPDVLVKIRHPSGTNLDVLVEAKFLSGKSSEADDGHEAPTDQLAKQWDNLLQLSRKCGTRPMLIYLTTDIAAPVKDLCAARAEFARKRGGEDAAQTFECYWLSWRHLSSLVDDPNSPTGVESNNSENQIRDDLKQLLNRLGLFFFKGISVPGQPLKSSWHFEGLPVRFNWGDVRWADNNWEFAE